MTEIEAERAMRVAIEAAVKDVLEQVRRAAYQAGRDDALRQMYAAVAAALPTASGSITPPAADDAPSYGAVIANDTNAVKPSDYDAADAPAAKRAPRGLTTRIVTEILSGGFALPMDEVQRRAVAADSRISAKTVYNELYRGNIRGSAYFRDRNARWRLRLPTDDTEQLKLADAPSEREQGEALTAHH